jgi:hypothetical protein
VIADVRPVGAGPWPLPVGADAGSPIGITEPLLQVCIVVPRAMSIRGIVPSVFDLGATVDVDASASLVDTAAAPVPAATPIPPDAHRPSA